VSSSANPFAGVHCPVVEPAFFAERWALALLRDPRDLLLLRVMAIVGGLMWPILTFCFLAPSFPWIAYIAYVLILVLNADRVLLMMHVAVHRPIFKAQFWPLEGILHLFLGPLFGCTPGTFYAHHVAMHHAEENMADDGSSTLAYERDNFLHWLHYAVKFQVFGFPGVIRYFLRTGKRRPLRALVLGESLHWLVAIALFWFAPLPATLFVIAPVFVVRFMLMAGNFAQHAFVDPNHPSDAHKNAYNLLDSRLNARAYNDGFHVVHHRFPGMHWSEMPAWHAAHLAEEQARGTMHFSGIADFIEMWALLMTRNYAKIASRYVRAPGDTRTDAEIVTWLKSLTRPLPNEKIVSLSEAQPA
jgi:fatty acid desaturase